MFYLIKTRFCVGIYLSKVAADFTTKKVNARVDEYTEYEKAKEKLKEIERDADFPIPWNEFRFNYLYKIRDDRTYIVIYTRKRAGFVNVENLSDFLEFYKIDISSSKTSRRSTYTQAVQFVWNLGVDTGDDICGAKTPTIWKYYRRNKNIWKRRKKDDK